MAHHPPFAQHHEATVSYDRNGEYEQPILKRRRITYEALETAPSQAQSRPHPHSSYQLADRTVASASWSNHTVSFHDERQVHNDNLLSFRAKSFGCTQQVIWTSQDTYASYHATNLDPSTVSVVHAFSPSPLPNTQQYAPWPIECCGYYPQIQNIEAPPTTVPESSFVDITISNQVCFGMIKNLQARLFRRLSSSIAGCPVAYALPAHLTSGGDILGKLDDRSAQILKTLHEDSSVEVQIVLKPGHSSVAKQKGLSLDQRQHPDSVSVILYGPEWLADDVGKFCQTCDIYLQEPHGCDRNVLYYNPHCLSSSEDERYMTFELQTHSADVAITHLKHSDTLDAFITSRQLGELASPSGLRTQLLPHQRQALYFMAQRELGWALGGASYDLWTELEDNCQTIYRNNITGAMHFCKPTQFKGGILADSMGLGKSCSIIALLVHDSDKHREDPNAPNLGTRNVSATLLIVPPTLLQTWEEQLQKHLRDVALLKVRRHHGSSRISTIDEARSCGLVITTYQTVETEWRAGMVSESSLLFSVNWQRIVLDEAHYVSNHQSNTAQAVCNLEARARWAVTGTPLQNRLGDIATLCQFLRVYPYNSRETFNRDIVNPWKAGNNEVAITRLKTLLQCILLRRSQGTVELPKRTDLKFTLQLSREERKHYEKVESCAARSVDAALHDTKSSGKAFASIIQQINELRLVCNLGTRRKPPRQATTQPDIIWDSPTAQKAMDAMAATESMSCTSCGLILDTVGLDNSLGMELSAASSRFWLFSCLSIVCEGCMRRNPMTRCGCVSFCSRAVVIHTPEKIASASSPPAESPSDIDEEPLPTKVQALIRDLLEQAPGVKSIVFTFWSSTLDLVAKGLSQASVMYTRYDGNTTPANRSLALKSFRKNPGISVILMTISCAAVGLDITAASRAYILEPQWNPTVEEQALARVHRMGQTKEVTTIRLVMADTFEERVVETQQRKKELAELLLAPEQHTEPEHSLDRLRYFRSLLK